MKVFIFACWLLLFPVALFAQSDSPNYSNAIYSEKIYLQLDKQMYTSGSTLWFKCIILNANTHEFTAFSKVLVVELISPEKTVLETKLIHLDKGLGEGFFDLDEDLPQNTYLIRAYTRWNNNFRKDLSYEQYFQVFTDEDQEQGPITNVVIRTNEQKERILDATFNPLILDSLHRDKLKVTVTLDGEEEKLVLNKDRDRLYQLNYDLSDSAEIGILQMQTSTNRGYSTTVVLQENGLDLQFFPESGKLVDGLINEVGFKAIGPDGRGVKVSGKILDDSDSLIAAFRSNELGMGSFKLYNIDGSRQYHADLDSGFSTFSPSTFDLPDVTARGNILSVDKRGDKVMLAAYSNYLENDSIYIRLSSRGLIYFNIKAKLRNGICKLMLGEAKLPGGIISCTLLNAEQKPLAERLYFNLNLDKNLDIEVKSNQDTYTRRDLTSLDFNVSGSSDSTVASLSVLVINKRLLGQSQQLRQNILSYLLLDSELQGTIESPGFYFGDSVDHFRDLDALMLTQGWREYIFDFDAESEWPYTPEKSLTVSGRVSGVFSEKKSKEADLTLITMGEQKSIYTQLTDSVGQFRFDLDIQFGGEMNVMIQTTNTKGKNIDYTIAIDDREVPDISFDHLQGVRRPDSIANVFVQKERERKVSGEFDLIQWGDVMLEDIVVSGYELTPVKKEVNEKYGSPEIVYSGQKIQAKEQKWSSGLYSVLKLNFPGLKVDRDTLGNLQARVVGSDMTLIVVDGVPVKIFDFPLLENIPPSEVKSVEVIKCTDIMEFNRLYMEVMMAPDLPTGIQCGSIIAIYTNSGGGLYQTDKAKGILNASVPIFSTPKEFYAPKYENITGNDWIRPDLRSVMHWEPMLNTDENGNAATSFYNSDYLGDMMVIVEAISDKGEIGYQEFTYTIKEK